MSQAIPGLAIIVFLAWLTSSNRRAFPWRLVLVGFATQLVLALALLKIPVIQDLLLLINRIVLLLEAATSEGTQLVFGYLGGGPAPFEVSVAQNTMILAFRALPIVIVFSALSALLWHWRVIPVLVRGFTAVLTRTLGLSGAVSVGSAASVFVGMVESPLLIKPYLAKMSRPELFVLMTCGMATVAGTVMGLYASILTPVLPDALSHILVASLVSAPAAIMLAAVMVPSEQVGDAAAIDLSSPYLSSMDAVVTGTNEGLRLLGNIVAMLIVFIALVFLADQMLGLLKFGGEPLSLIGLAGKALTPLAYLLGIPWSEAQHAGELLATKVFINELVAYLQLAASEPGQLSAQSELILTYALCGFANFGSLGIMLGGLTALCPERRVDIMQLAPRSLWSGLLATSMTGALVGLLA